MCVCIGYEIIPVGKASRGNRDSDYIISAGNGMLLTDMIRVSLVGFGVGGQGKVLTLVMCEGNCREKIHNH